MTFEIVDRLSLKIVFNGEEYPFQRANSFDFIHMTASTKLSVPMLHFALQDNVGWLSQTKHLGDAARIQLVIASKSSQSVTYTFRLNYAKREPNSGGYRYSIDAYLDASTYWHASTRDAIQGTSKKALISIASACGLFFDGHDTSDDQLWLPRNMTYAQWAKAIADRGYRSDSSCMQLGLNFNKLLTYRDLSDPKPSVAKFNFGGYKQGSYMASEVVPTMSAGSANHYSGYADAVVEQDTESSDVNKTRSQVTVAVKATDGNLQMNERVKDAVQRSSFRFAPIDVGNTHAAYEQALYQNRRLNNLFSTQIELITPNATTLNLLDSVDLTIDGAHDYLKSYTGQYQVATRTIHLTGNDYFEKLVLLRKTVNGQIVSSK